MRRFSPLALLPLVLAALPLRAQDFSAYLGAGAGSRAASLLSAMDAAAAALAKSRAEIRARMVKEEGGALLAYALDSASQGGENWALPDASLLGSGAAEAFATSRAKALALAEELAASTWGAELRAGKEAIGSRELAAAKLEALVRAAPDTEKALLGIERILKPGASLSRLFPEALELGSALRKAGREGRMLWLAALARRTAPEMAAYLSASREGIESLSPASRETVDRLEAALAAYSGLIQALPVAAYPSELAVSALHKADTIGKAMGALLDLAPARSASLLGAMQKGDGLEAAAAAAAARFALIADALPAARRTMLQRAAFVSPSALARFSALAAPSPVPVPVPVPAPKPDPEPAGLEAQALELNGLAARFFAATGQDGTAKPGQAEEPALLLLERPELGSLAAGEARYAGLAAEARLRLARLYHAADETVRTALSRDARLLKTAAKALGAKPASLAVEAADLGSGKGGFGRRVTFVARATGPGGTAVLFPVAAELAAPAYASALARNAQIPAPASPAGGFLARYDQSVVSSLDLDDGGHFLLSALPRAGESLAHDYAEAEIRLLEGWKP
ncbi:MAG TPA: hypothetical protein VFL04_01220 [Rectinemataceae bacterium]|nr:hypothetical protein [Rectinemataceae bacterium]